MNNKTITDILDQMATQDTTWIAAAKSRQENKEWHDRSARIAIRILTQLRDNKKMEKYPTNQKELAELMRVSPQQINKIVKGNENLTLETIARLEALLQTPLLDDASSPTEDVAFGSSSTVSYFSVTQINAPVELFNFNFETIEVKTVPTENTTDTALSNSNYVYAMAA